MQFLARGGLRASAAALHYVSRGQHAVLASRQQPLCPSTQRRSNTVARPAMRLSAGAVAQAEPQLLSVAPM